MRGGCQCSVVVSCLSWQEQAAVGVMRDQFNFDIFWDFRKGVK